MLLKFSSYILIYIQLIYTNRTLIIISSCNYLLRNVIVWKFFKIIIVFLLKKPF